LLFIYIETETDSANSVVTELEKLNHTVALSSRHDDAVIIKINNEPKTEKKLRELITKDNSISGVTKVTAVPKHLNVREVELEQSLRTNKCRFVFDVDSTLTHGDPGTIHPEVEDILQKINERGIRIYFATGRSMYDLNILVQSYPVEKYSICENGGMLLGFPPDNYFEFGKKAEPQKVLDYLQSKYRVKEDMAQGERFTEVIFLQKDVTRKQIDEAIRAKSARVDVHASKNSYHISKHKVNKGTAMLEVAKRLHWKKTMIIAVGDADMDIPMFEKAGYSFAVGNASPDARKAASKCLTGKYHEGVKQIYDIIKHL